MVNDKTFKVTALQMGNPNCCLFVEDFEALNWRSIEKQLRLIHSFRIAQMLFFVKPLDRETIELRIWERGVGETTASGTCSCAAAVASMVKGLTERLVRVITPEAR